MWPFKKRELKNSGYMTRFVKLGKASWSARNYSAFAEEAYIRNVVAYRCIRMIAEAASNIPWLIYKGKSEATDHPLHNLLSAPNSDQGGAEFFDQFYSYLQISGNAFIDVIQLDSKSIEALDNLRPDRFKPVISGNKLAGWEYKIGSYSRQIMLPPASFIQKPLIHFKLFHPTDDIFGMSPIEAAAYSIDVHNAASAFNKSMLDNVATPSGALQTTQELTDDQYARLKQDLEDRQGVKAAGKPLLLEGGLTWQAMAFSPKDLDFVEGKREAAREVALAFGVPPLLLGIAGDSTYSNYKEANRAFYRQTVLPLVSKVCEHFTVIFRPTYGKDLKVSYNPDGIEALAEERKELWDRVRFATWLTVDEKRDATGYTKLPDGKGEVLLVPSRDVPIEQAGDQQQQVSVSANPPKNKPPKDPKNNNT